MSIAFDSVCLQCQMKRNLELARSLGSEEQAMEFARDMMRVYLDGPRDVASPWFTAGMEELLQKHYGLTPNRMDQEKRESNAFVLERMEMLREKALSAPDPVYAGLQLSILGNYLDFAALRGQVRFEKLEEMLTQALEMELDRQIYDRFCRELDQGRELLYLTDNAGEIGFDRILAERIAERYPHLTVTFCVRGGAVVNDATREDAEAVGIPFPVIDNGNRIPGTQLNRLSAEAEAAVNRADVILAKGMANCETLLGCGLNVYYAFLVKCQRFVNRFGKPMLTPVLEAERK